MFLPLVNPSILTLDWVTDEMVMMSPSFIAVFLVSQVYFTKSKLTSGSGDWRVGGLDTSAPLTFSLSSDSVPVVASSVSDFSLGVVPLNSGTEPTKSTNYN